MTDADRLMTDDVRRSAVGKYVEGEHGAARLWPHCRHGIQRPAPGQRSISTESGYAPGALAVAVRHRVKAISSIIVPEVASPLVYLPVYAIRHAKGISRL